MKRYLKKILAMLLVIVMAVPVLAYDGESYCENCGETCPYTLEYEEWGKTYHCIRWWCSNCGGDSGYETAYHDTETDYYKYDSTRHEVIEYCYDCDSEIDGYLESHSLKYGSWTNYSDSQHRRSVNCYDCCDSCSSLLFRFSVTVPAMLVMAVSEYGNIYEAVNAEVINNSSHAVEIKSVSVLAGDDWTLVPYRTNMADEKVDSKLIGFYLNDAVTTTYGDSEELILPDNWTIDRDSSFRLYYDAVVPAASDILMNEQVLTLVFVIDWAPR